jgi:hypothetical protein
MGPCQPYKTYTEDRTKNRHVVVRVSSELFKAVGSFTGKLP